MATNMLTVVDADDRPYQVAWPHESRHRRIHWSELEMAASEANSDPALRTIYADALAQVVEQRDRAREAEERARDEASWYALVTFGLPTPYDGERIGRGMRERNRLIRLAQEAMGTGTCTTARVVRCESEAEARAADISEQRRVVFTT